MTSDWIETTIGKQVTLQRGIDITKSEQRSGLVPVVSSGGVSSYHDTSAVHGPGVILGRKGVVGSVYFVASDYWPHDTTLWVKDFHGNDRRFVYYFFKWMAPRIATMDVGSANPTLNRNHVHPIVTRWPPLSDQRAIACILGTLDDKIELNRRMNETLEAMARAVFNSWFVDFDPVIDNALKACNPIPDALADKAARRREALARARAEGRPVGLPEHLKGLFPDGFEESDFGDIPKGWKPSRWGDLVSLEYGKSLNGYDAGSGTYPVYGTNGRIGSHSQPLCPHPGIIIGRKGAYRGVHFCNSPFFVIDTAFYIKPKTLLEMRWAFYEILRQDINSMDSGSAIPSTSRADFYSLLVLVPQLAIQQRFVELMNPLWARQERNEEESLSLAALRDTLLPKLLSGELRVKDLDEFLAAKAPRPPKLEPVYSIGHSNHPIQFFINQLKKHNITAVADVRSSPSSKHNTHFNQDVLAQALKKSGIAYVFLGAELGGRPKDSSCYTDGTADFGKISETLFFKEGIERLCKGREKYRIALLCAEKEPLDCHRTILVSRHLRRIGVSVKHILADGSVEDQPDTERRLLRKLGLDNSLFDSGSSVDKLIEKAYEKQGRIIAFKPNGRKQ